MSVSCTKKHASKDQRNPTDALLVLTLVIYKLKHDLNFTMA